MWFKSRLNIFNGFLEFLVPIFFDFLLKIECDIEEILLKALIELFVYMSKLDKTIFHREIFKQYKCDPNTKFLKRLRSYGFKGVNSSSINVLDMLNIFPKQLFSVS